MSTNYDRYNREERYLCAHLFRLLHEPASDCMALREFLKVNAPVRDSRIYCEVALIRDAYADRGYGPHGDERPQFMEQLVSLVAAQESIEGYTPYSRLKEPEWRNPSATHPRQIRHKAAGSLSPDDKAVYGAVQAMFNAKPDLAICIDSQLVVYEAKLTTAFDNAQIRRTEKIAKVWAELLYSDLGFGARPRVEVRKLGRKGTTADTTWDEVFEIAKRVYSSPSDRTLLALESALRLHVGSGED